MTVGGCPANLEAAIMFLYGVSPNITTESITHLLDLAEFLLIPNLKALLVKWLKGETVTHDNFIPFLHLASLYEFDFPNCENYIRANLDKCFENRDFLYLTKESVIALLSDSTLIYVGSDSKFKFILDWLRCRGPAWYDVSREFIQLIVMEEVSPYLIAEAQNDPVFQSCNLPISTSKVQSPQRTALIMREGRWHGVYLVYDLERSLWFRLTPELIDADILDKDQSSTNAVVYKGYNSVTRADFNLDTTTQTTLVNETGETLPISSRTRNCYNNGIVWSTHYYRAHIQISKRPYHKKSTEQKLLEATLGIVDGLDDWFLNRSTQKSVATIYKGIINTNNGETSMTPVLSFPFEPSSGICINESNIIGCLRRDKNWVYIFDANTYSLDILSAQQIGYSDKLYPTRHGFLIYDDGDTRVLDISPMTGPIISSRSMIVSEIKLKSAEREQYRYQYVENMWIRYNSSYERDAMTCVDWVSHDALKLCSSVEELTWTPMTQVQSRSQYYLMKNAVKVNLSQSKLRCHADCPHCEWNKEHRDQQLSRQRTHELVVYFDDSDESVYLGDYYNDYYYDSSDGYYDYSD